MGCLSAGYRRAEEYHKVCRMEVMRAGGSDAEHDNTIHLAANGVYEWRREAQGTCLGSSSSPITVVS